MRRRLPWLYIDSPPMGDEVRPRSVHPVPRESWRSLPACLPELVWIFLVLETLAIVVLGARWLGL